MAVSCTKGEDMTQAQKTFEAIMVTNGHNDFTKTKNGRYAVSTLQTRWRYFLLGWELRGTI
jgi:hypothetical protein